MTPLPERGPVGRHETDDRRHGASQSSAIGGRPRVGGDPMSERETDEADAQFVLHSVGLR